MALLLTKTQFDIAMIGKDNTNNTVYIKPHLINGMPTTDGYFELVGDPNLLPNAMVTTMPPNCTSGVALNLVISGTIDASNGITTLLDSGSYMFIQSPLPELLIAGSYITISTGLPNSVNMINMTAQLQNASGDTFTPESGTFTVSRVSGTSDIKIQSSTLVWANFGYLSVIYNV